MASGHKFRNGDKIQVLGYREWIREHCPGARQGMVVEDLDLVPLLFGGLINRHYNDNGQFMLVEIKNTGFGVNYAQKRLFGMMDTLFRFSDPDKTFYLGFFLVWWDHEKNKPTAINMEPCSEAEFSQWMQGKAEFPAYNFMADHQVGKAMKALWDSLFRN